MQSKVIKLLATGPMQKSELSKSLGQKAISAQLNAVVRNACDRSVNRIHDTRQTQ